MATSTVSGAPALAAAVEQLSAGALAAVPVAGPWSAETIVSLVSAASETAPATTLVANLRTGLLWGSRAHSAALLAYLEGGDVDPPPAEWDLGRYVNLAAVLAGPKRSLVLVRDSYRSLGADGHHLQPAEAIASALRRKDGRGGGVLCFTLAGDESTLRARLAADGFELGDWDNGSG